MAADIERSDQRSSGRAPEGPLTHVTGFLDHWWSGYFVAVVSVAVVAAIRYALLLTGVDDASRFLLFAAAVVAAAWVGGFGPALAATLLSLLVIYPLYLEPVGSYGGASWGATIEALLFLGQGLFIGALGHAKVRARQAEQASYAALEDRVALRTAELARAKDDLEAQAEERERDRELLRETNTRLEQSNRELQDFASVASHDLQEPLRKIRAFGDRLVQRFGDQFPEGADDYLSRMLNAAERMQVLINDLLTFSRVTSKAQPFVPTDLEQIAREVAADLEARIEQTGATVQIGGLPTIDADPLQMRQLLQNLIGNALKFGREGVPPVVRVEAELVDAAPDPEGNGHAVPATVRVLVSDNGIGFDEKYLDRIFNVFQRLHGRQAYEGTGIGLAVCRKIAHRHGGDITARSEPGVGATFIVTLPREHPESEDHALAQAHHHPAR